MNGDAMRKLADSLDDFADAIGPVMSAAMLAVADRAADNIRDTVPVDTRATRDGVRVDSVGGFVTLTIGTDYASYIFEAGDQTRIPIYPRLLADAFQAAVNDVGIAAQVVDMTEAYFGQGRTTTNITGPTRKMIQHAPPHEADAWRANNPEMITRVMVDGAEIELVPSDFIDAGQAGTRRFSPRGG